MCEECPGAWLAPVQGCCHANSTSHRADVPVYFLLTLSFDHAVPAPYIAHERAKPESERLVARSNPFPPTRNHLIWAGWYSKRFSNRGASRPVERCTTARNTKRNQRRDPRGEIGRASRRERV